MLIKPVQGTQNKSRFFQRKYRNVRSCTYIKNAEISRLSRVLGPGLEEVASLVPYALTFKLTNHQ